MTLFDTSDQWIVERTGIRERRAADGPFVHPKPPVSPPDGMGTTAQLAAEAGRGALEMAGLDGADIDLLVLCTTSPDQMVPATSSPLANALSIKGGGMDINAACAGFTYGLVAAAGFIATGAERVLLIGAETLTRITDWSDRSNAFLFGDGAGAVVVEAVPGEPALLGWDIGVDGSLQPLFYADFGGRDEDARPRGLPKGRAGNGRLGHQEPGARKAQRRTTSRSSSRTRPISGLWMPWRNASAYPSDRIASVIEHDRQHFVGVDPDRAYRGGQPGRLKDGDIVLFAGFGAGMTWASAVWRWGANPAR